MQLKGVNIVIKGTSDLAPAARRVQSQLGTVDRAVGRTRREMNALTVANARFSESLGGSSWKRQVQQVGMQMSDFSVQVASGQSAILAFTQNAPQFIQNFGAMGGVLAAVVTILGTFAFAAQRSRGETMTFQEHLDRTTESSKDLFDVIEGRGGIAATIFEKMRKDIEGFAAQSEALLAGTSARVTKNAIQMADAVRKLAMPRGFRGDLAEVAELLGKFEETVGSGPSEVVREFQQALDGLQTAQGVQEHYDVLVRIKQAFHDVVDLTSDSTTAQLDFNDAIEAALLQLRLVGAAEKAVATEAVEQLRLEQLRKIEMQRLVEIGRVRLQQQAEYAQAKAQADQNSLTAMAQYVTSRSTAAQMQQRELELLQQSYPVAVEMTNIMQQQVAYAQAKARAEQKSYAAMAQYVMLRSMTPGQTPEDERAQKTLDIMRAQEEILAAQARFGSDSTETAAAQVRLERTRLEQMIETMGVSEEMARQMRDSFDQQQTYQAQIEAQAGSIADEVVPQVRDAADEITTIFDTMQSAIGRSMLSGFKSVLKGAQSFGDAARDILGNILDTIIDILMTPVFNSLASSVATSLGGSLGMDMTAEVPSAEGGGFTGYGARVGGLDGRGGMLAMVHPNETVVDHTKGQSVGGDRSVVIHVHGVQDTQGFRRSQRQIVGEMRRAMESY